MQIDKGTVWIRFGNCVQKPTERQPTNQPTNQPNNAKEENAQMYHRNKDPTVKLVYMSNIDPNTHF